MITSRPPLEINLRRRPAGAKLKTLLFYSAPHIKYFEIKVSPSRQLFTLNPTVPLILKLKAI